MFTEKIKILVTRVDWKNRHHKIALSKLNWPCASVLSDYWPSLELIENLLRRPSSAEASGASAEERAAEKNKMWGVYCKDLPVSKKFDDFLVHFVNSTWIINSLLREYKESVREYKYKYKSLICFEVVFELMFSFNATTFRRISSSFIVSSFPGFVPKLRMASELTWEKAIPSRRQEWSRNTKCFIFILWSYCEILRNFHVCLISSNWSGSCHLSESWQTLQECFALNNSLSREKVEQLGCCPSSSE